MPVGTAWSAISILNATSTGFGASLPINAKWRATWTPSDAWDIHGAPDDRVIRAIAADQGLRPATVAVESPLPPRRGLKTSSSSIASLLRASGNRETGHEFVSSCVRIARAAGVTLTGAWDDQYAVSHGQLVLTEAPHGAVHARLAIPPLHVAIWVPQQDLDKSKLVGMDASIIASEIEEAKRELLAGKLGDAMTRNGAAFSMLYQANGIHIDDLPAQIALDHGAIGAGISGTGPSTAALFEVRKSLPELEGGNWEWHHTVEGDP